MTRFITRGLLALTATALWAFAFGTSPAPADVGLQNVTLACNDGTNLPLSLDSTALLRLSSAVAAIGLYPAGDPPLACSLTNSTATSSSGSGANGPHDFVVGGGQFFTSCGLTNFSISAHVADDAPVAPGQREIGGTYNKSTGANGPCGEGSFTSKVDCLQTTGDFAQWTSNIKHAKGLSSFFGSPGVEVAELAIDNAPDALGAEGGFFTSGPCAFAEEFPTTPIVHGNIDVHDA